MDIHHTIRQLIEPSLDDMGYTLVLVKLAEGKRKKTLTLMAERTDGQQMSFDDCTAISQTAGALLEVDDPISGAYNLEVCSPGIDRPLIRPEDYGAYTGHEIKLETMQPINGRKRFKGLLEAMENNTVCMQVDGASIQIPYDTVRSAKLVLTDALVAEHLKKHNATQNA